MEDILNSVYFGNSVKYYLLAIIWLVVGFILRTPITKLVIKGISQIFRKSQYNLTKEQYNQHLRKSLNFFVFVVFVFLAFDHLDFPSEWNMAPKSEFGLKKVIHIAYQLFLAFAITRIGLKIIGVVGAILRNRANETESKQDDQLIPFLLEIVKVLFVVIAVMIVAGSVLKLNISSLVAGLGIGGLAIALAAKESLENLFSSFTIFMDKPFVVGDMVSVKGVTGTIEKVGFRSTRIRTLEKSYVTLPNRLMIDAELDNLSLRTFRRVKFNLGLTYGTKASVIKSVCEKIQKHLDEDPHTNDDSQVKFMDFGAYSLDIMILYYIDTMDWDQYLKYKESINYRIMQIVEEEETDFAFPTQTVQLEQNKVGS